MNAPSFASLRRRAASIAGRLAAAAVFTVLAVLVTSCAGASPATPTAAPKPTEASKPAEAPKPAAPAPVASPAAAASPSPAAAPSPSPSPVARTAKTIRISYQPILIDAPLLIAKDKGY